MTQSPSLKFYIPLFIIFIVFENEDRGMVLHSLVQSLGGGGYGNLWVAMEVMTMVTKKRV